MPVADGCQRGDQGETQGKGRPGGRETRGKGRPGEGEVQEKGRPGGGPSRTWTQEGLQGPEQPSGTGKQQWDDQETKSRTMSK